MKYYLLFILSILMIACSESEFEDGKDLSDNLYPLSVGSNWLYRVDSITVNKPAGISDTTLAFIREEVTDIIAGDGDDFTAEIAQYYKAKVDPEIPWTLIGYITTRYDAGRYVRNEKETSLIKMVNPVFDGDVWNPTLFMNKDKKVTVGIDTFRVYQSWNSEISDVSYDYNLLGESLNNGVRVDLANVFDNSIYYEESYEVYAPNVGLVQAQYTFLEDTEFGPEPVKERFKRGFDIHKSIITVDIK